MTLPATIGGYDSTPIDVVGDPANYPRLGRRERKWRNKSEASCEACGRLIPSQGRGRPRKFCLECLPAGSPAEVAAAWRRLNAERIEAYRREVWVREREERNRRADEARRVLVEALRAQHQQGKAA
jgi:hypothetical protein